MLHKYLNLLLKRSGSSGFTLIELLIVIAIIGILVTIVVIAIDPAAVIQRTNDTKRRSELNQIKVSLQLYFNEKNRYPTDAELVSSSGGSDDFQPLYMKQLPSYIVVADYEASGADYDIGVVLQKPNTEDGKSKTRCDDSELIDWADYNYIVCPD